MLPKAIAIHQDGPELFPLNGGRSEKHKPVQQGPMGFLADEGVNNK